MLHPTNAEALAREHRNDLLRAAQRDHLAAEFHHPIPMSRHAAAVVGHLLMLGGRYLTRYAYAHAKTAPTM